MGTLKQGDIFVCGVHEGKVRLMKNDKGQPIKEATPGTAVHVVGFKHLPEVGHPLYSVNDHEMAKYIGEQVQKKRDIEHAKTKGVHVNKKVGKLSRIEKSRLYSGDKTVLYERLGLIEKDDIEHL